MKNDIGKMLKSTRIKQKITQEELAQRIGKKRSYISRIESLEGNKINIKTLSEIVEKGLGKELKIIF